MFGYHANYCRYEPANKNPLLQLPLLVPGAEQHAKMLLSEGSSCTEVKDQKLFLSSVLPLHSRGLTVLQGNLKTMASMASAEEEKKQFLAYPAPVKNT